jgi:hypothetical protein
MRACTSLVIAGLATAALADAVGPTEATTGVVSSNITPYWDAATQSLSGTMHVSQDAKTVTRVNSQGDEAITGNCVTGDGEWSVKLGFPDAHRYTYIGVQGQATQVCRWLGCTITSWALRADGFKSHDGTSDLAGGFRMNDNDIITIKLDKGVLRFYQNGIDKGVEFTGLPTDTPLCLGVSLFSPYSYATIQWLESNNPVNAPTPSPVAETQAVWDPTTITGNGVVDVSVNGLMATRSMVAPDTNQAVYGTCRLGTGDWKLKVTFPTAKRYTYIGLATYKSRTCRFVGCDAQSWGVRADGYRSHSGDSGMLGGFPIESGDLVEMKLADGKLEYFVNDVSKGVMFAGLPTTSPLCLAATLYSAHSTIEIQEKAGAVNHGIGGSGAAQHHMPTISGWDMRTVTHNQAISISPLHKTATRENYDAGNAESVRAGCIVGDGEWKVEVGFPAHEGTRDTYIGVTQLGTVACRWVGCSVFSWGAIATGKLAHNNHGDLDGGFTMDDRDIVTVRLKGGALQFDKNGISVGTVFENLPQDKPLCLSATLSAPSATVTILAQPTTVNQQPTVAPADWSTGSPTVWDDTSIVPQIAGLFSLDTSKKVVTRTNSFKLATIEGHCYVGHGSWKVQLSAQQHNNAGDIAVDYVGVQVAGTQCDWVGCDTNSWGVRSDGRKSHAGSNEIMGGFEMHDHDIVEVVVEKGALFFTLNGVPQGKMFEGLPEDKALCFATTMYSPASSATFLRPAPACALPAQPDRGSANVHGQWVGALAEFTCEPGFLMSGSAQRRCSQNGEWTGKTTFCSKDPCGDLGSVKHGTVHKQVVAGIEEANYSCKDDTFTLVGVAKRQCNEGVGEWSAAAPACKKECGRVPPTPDHASVAFAQTYEGSTATYTCDEGYFVSGQSKSSTVTCKPSGLWSGTPSACSPQRCGMEEEVKHAVSSQSCKTFGCITAYRCETPYTMVGAPETKCQADGTWSDAPICVMVKPCKEIKCQYHDKMIHVDKGLTQMPAERWRTIVRHPFKHTPEPHGTQHRCQFEKVGAKSYGKCVCECWNTEDLTSSV